MSMMKTKQAELQKGGGGSDFGFDKLESGKNVRRILPPKGDSDMFYSEGFLHFGLGEDGKTAVTCLKTFDKKCPICEYIDSIKNSKNKEDKEFVNNAKATKRIYINVLNRDSDDEEETPKVLPIGKMILKQLIDIICDPDYGDITDFDEGRDVTITKSGKGMNTEYSVLAKPKNSVASEQYDEEELDELLPDLESLFVEKSEEELVAILSGEEYSKDDEEESEDDEDLDYDDMDLEDLKYLCEERGISVPKKNCTKARLISLLEEYDEDDSEEDEEYEEDEDEDDSDDEADDDLMASVKNAVKNKRASRK